MRRRLYAAAILFVALWPACHLGLARHFEFDGWNLFGWAMYASPDRTVEIAAGRIVGRTMEPLPIPTELRESTRRFVHERATWGRRVRPDALAQEIAATTDVADGLALRVRTWRIDPISGRVEAVDEEFGYRSAAQ